jgi:hypothetical protein
MKAAYKVTDEATGFAEFRQEEPMHEPAPFP